MIQYASSLECCRCLQKFEESDAFAGCPRCASEGVPASLRPTYDILREDGGDFLTRPERWRSALPLSPDDELISLHEGDTPLLELARLGRGMEVGQLLLKDESRGPTWSWKDRLARAAISKAKADGSNTVVVATTGNFGAAVAAYCAVAGLRCVALTTTTVPSTMRTLMQVYGADVVAYENGPDRWRVMQEAVNVHGWVPMSNYTNPPLGSNPFGVDGYKFISFEIVRELGRVPDFVIAPASYGDGLVGIHRGFEDLVRLGYAHRTPRMVPAEVHGQYTQALLAGSEVPGPVSAGPSIAFSAATPVGAYQVLDVLKRSGGQPVLAGDDGELLQMQYRLASSEGLYQEATSVMPLVGLKQLSTNFPLEDACVVVIGTSSGLKDVGVTREYLPPPVVLPPTLSALEDALGTTREG